MVNEPRRQRRGGDHSTHHYLGGGRSNLWQITKGSADKFRRIDGAERTHPVDSAVGDRLLKMSAATIDRFVTAGSCPGKVGPTEGVSEHAATQEPSLFGLTRVATIRRPVTSKWTWWRVAEGSVAGSHLHSLVLTDVASGWAEGRLAGRLVRLRAE